MTQRELFGDGIARSEMADATYRYFLRRDWTREAEEPRALLWVMFNPSTANGVVDDPTIRRCTDFSQRWGFTTFDVVNLYALRAAERYRVFDHPDPVGPHNDAAIVQAVARATAVVVAWGSVVGPGQVRREGFVFSAIEAAGLVVECLGQTFAGHPWHPLYIPGVTPRRPFTRRRS